jgi:hypothetical protein
MKMMREGIRSSRCAGIAQLAVDRNDQARGWGLGGHETVDAVIA